VERSVAISTFTTKELVSKDFAQEPNELRMQRAAHLMTSNLAGALVRVPVYPTYFFFFLLL
jgi:hypothetical protein